jgi:hypothetical protein
VRDPVEPAGTTDTATTTTAAPPAQEISHTINPEAGFDIGRGPSQGPTSGGGDIFASTSSAATAADATTDPPTGSSDISLVGSGSGAHGIQSVASDAPAAEPAPAASDATRGSESFAATGGDDDDLEELQVQRYVNPDAADATSAVAPTDSQITHVITSGGGATDVVMGFEPAQIEGDPSSRPLDLVGNPSEPAGSAEASTVTVAPLGQDISHTISPDLGLGADGGPSLAPRPSAADDMLYGSSSSAATSANAGAESKLGADDNAPGGAGPDSEEAAASEQPVAGAEAESKLNADDTTSGSAGAHSDEAAATEQPGAGAEEQSKIDATTSGGADQRGDEAAAPDAAPSANGSLTVVDAVAPVVEYQSVDLQPVDAPPVDDAPLPADDGQPDPTINPDPAPFEAPSDSFVGLQVDDSLAVPDQVDLDDGF